MKTLLKNIAEKNVHVPSDTDIFVGGPPLGMQRQIGLVSPGRLNISCRMGLVMLLTWVPLAGLSTWHDWYAGNTFFADFNSHARYLIAAPLLIAAEGNCLARLSSLAENFRKTGLVSTADQSTFDRIAVSIRRLLNSAWAETAIVAIAYLLILLAFTQVHVAALPAWARMPSAQLSLTPAGWWAMLVSLPLLLILLLGWIWRLFLWTRFLWLMSRLNLRLVTVHPDGAAGLGFVGYSSQAFIVLAFALGALAAGKIANAVSAGAAFDSFHLVICGFVAAVVFVLNAPLLVFMLHLLRVWRRGTLEYGVLAEHFGREFERKWFNRAQPLDGDVLTQPDFSAATDLYQVVDRAYDMWMTPMHLKSMAMLAIATLLPFVPVALMSVPFDVIVSRLTHLIF